MEVAWRFLAVDSFAPQSHGCVSSVQNMQVETKFLHLCQPVALGEDGWRVHWVGRWGRDRLFFYMMVGKGEELDPNLLLRSREYSHARRACGRWSDTDVEEGWCDNIEEEHRWREYEKARLPR